jgi:hypothetical protein
MIELLPSQNSLTRCLKDYLDFCKLEGKSLRTLQICRSNIERYLRQPRTKEGIKTTGVGIGSIVAASAGSVTVSILFSLMAGSL